MRPPRLLKTASFKLAALYALIFGASVIVLAAVVYFTATAALKQETRTRIQVETEALKGEYRTGGLDQMMDAIRDRQRGRLIGALAYAVYDTHGHRLLGVPPPSPYFHGWSEMKGPPDGDEPPGRMEHLIVLSTPLSNGLWLTVGDDIGRVKELGRVIMATFGWALVLMITLAIGGGILLSIGFLGRVDAITRTAEAIIGGDVQRRIPLRGAHDDLDRLAGTLNRMLDRITALMDALRQVSSDIAHDLRTPLGRLRHTLDEIRSNAQSPAQCEEAVDRAIAETDAILETFAALLRIAQIEAGTRRAGFRHLDFSELVETIGQTFAPVAEDEGRSLIARIAPGIAVDGDRELLAQMLANLIENAIRHTPLGAAIVVELAPRAEGPALVISDNGPGIPQTEREHVLTRFYRLERSRTTPGNGLGLSLVAAIAELHGASLTLEDNNPGLRAVVTFAGHRTETAPQSSQANASRSQAVRWSAATQKI